MLKRELARFKKLMKESLNPKNSSNKRADSFNNLFSEYTNIDPKCIKWGEFRIKLRRHFANKLTQNQKKKYALARSNLKKSYFEIKDSIPKSQKSFFPVELFYEVSFSIIQKISKKGDLILDIGYGDFPLLTNLLNRKGYEAYGIDPFPKQFDKDKTFKCKINNLPRKIRDLRYNLILVNMVYSVNYTSHYSKYFKWELKHKAELIKKLHRLLEKKGFLILIDDIGTIFPKRDLEKYFRILLFEKDIEVINFDTNKVEDFGKITLLQKK